MMIEHAFAFMKKAHEGQVTKSGEPYWTHPLAVMELLPIEATEDERVAALLHDVIEDCDVTAKDLREAGFSDRSVALVESLSRPEGVTYMDWIRQIADRGDRGLILIKLADNTHNSLPERIETLPEDKRDIVKRYERSMKILRKALETTP